MQGQQVEDLVGRITVMERPNLVALLREMNCDFQIDFTDDFLASISLERLRHIVLAASLHCHPHKATCA